MQNTVCDGCTKKKCPNKISTPWQNEKGEVTMVQDCAPKRTMIMVQQLHNTLLGVQKSQDEMRNKFNMLEASVSPVANVKGFYIDQDVSGP